MTVTPGSKGVATVGTVSGSHTYGEPGVYPVTVSVADDGGGVGQGSFAATVKDVGPTLAPLPDGGFIQGLPFTIQESFTEPGGADRETVTVSWGDGSVSTIDNQSTYANSSGALVPYIVEPTATDPGTITLGHVYNGDGPYQVTITITDEDGLSDSVTATYQSEIPTTITLIPQTSTTTSVFGQPVTFLATVSNQLPGFPMPSGIVTFYDDGVAIGTQTTSENHVAVSFSFTTLSLPVGSQAITATFTSESGEFKTSTTLTAMTQTVERAATTTSVASSINPMTYGQATTFTATISVNIPGSSFAASPTGTVTFYDGTTQLGPPVRVVTSGHSTTATLLWSGLGGSLSHTIKAVYSGDGNFAGGSGSVSQSVYPDPTTTTISSTAASTDLGQAITFTATVTADSPGAGTPAGSVEFEDLNTGNDLGSVMLAAQSASVTVSSLVAGTHVITAIYSGESNFQMSTASPARRSPWPIRSTF